MVIAGHARNDLGPQFGVRREHAMEVDQIGLRRKQLQRCPRQSI